MGIGGCVARHSSAEGRSTLFEKLRAKRDGLSQIPGGAIKFNGDLRKIFTTRNNL
jgi:hypothetical protein